MNCHAVVELVTDYLERALPPETADAVARHLRSCADCDRYVDEMCWTLDLLAKLPPEPPPRLVWAQLQATFHTWAAARCVWAEPETSDTATWDRRLREGHDAAYATPPRD